MTDRPTVLVTGGAGYIGSHAVLALADAGWPVVVLDNLSTGFREAIPPGVPLVEGDTADTALVARTIAGHGVGAVIHFAGSIIVPESVRDPIKYYRNNLVGVLGVIEAAVAGGVKHIIFSSTATVYGLPETTPIPEDAPIAPISPYGHTKAMTETILADVSRAHPINHCVLRYFNVAGADPKGRSGQSTVGATHLIKVAAEAALGKRSHVDINGRDYDTADGTGVRDYIHVSDLAAAHVAALEALVAEPERSLVLNCGYGHGSSVIEVLDAVDRVTNRTIDRREAPRREGDADTLVSNNAAILAALDWRPRYDDLDRIVADAVAWERALAERRG